MKIGPEKKILDACCGGRMMWFQKNHPNALFIDNRRMAKQVIWRGEKGQKRSFEVEPDVVMDFRNLDLRTNSFTLVVFDPPHLATRNGRTGYMQKKYGSLDPEMWRDDIAKGFAECFRVLKRNGVLVFKWSEAEIPLGEVLALTPYKPLFGHVSGRYGKTHWLTFMKF